MIDFRNIHDWELRIFSWMGLLNLMELVNFVTHNFLLNLYFV